ncbi:hypothetical protein B1R32_11221 [Abditibacterium utsteinense]|uniref:Uncharacterized protein n=1 Tax=Abditibacterium utsteinense TaxID=1960156 RepID=A0A2S8SRG1_9BACT|nr:hypothetical protein [Abditibacterium utsteinense]PQV63366.1 hypothetical protein B1R32_11221 [Abditibacterium utsteinense]
MKITKQRTIALGTLGALSATLLGGAMVAPAQASSSTWKKVAIGGAAATGYGLLKHKGKIATIGGLVTAGSYLKYRSDKKKESKIEARRAQYYRQRYGSNWRAHYRAGV